MQHFNPAMLSKPSMSVIREISWLVKYRVERIVLCRASDLGSVSIEHNLNIFILKTTQVRPTETFNKTFK